MARILTPHYRGYHCCRKGLDPHMRDQADRRSQIGRRWERQGSDQ